MDSGAEGDVPVRLALQIEPFGVRVRLRIHVGGGQHRHDLVALSQPDAAELDILPHIARFGNCTGETKRKNSSTARSMRLQSSSEPVAQIQDFSEARIPIR